VTTWTSPPVSGFDAVWTGTELGVLTSRRTSGAGPYQHLLFRLDASGTPLTTMPTDVTPPLIARPFSGPVHLAWSAVTGYVVRYDGSSPFLHVLNVDGTSPDAPFAMPFDGATAISPSQFGILGRAMLAGETRAYLHFVAISHDGTSADPTVTLNDDTVNTNGAADAYDGTSWVASWSETTTSAPLTSYLRLARGPGLATRTMLDSATLPAPGVGGFGTTALVVADATVWLLVDHDRTAPSAPRIDLERFDLAYTRLFPVVPGILSATGTLPSVVGSETDRITFAWEDTRDPTTDIYASSFFDGACP
jgi:hypothetical protein